MKHSKRLSFWIYFNILWLGVHAIILEYRVKKQGKSIKNLKNRVKDLE